MAVERVLSNLILISFKTEGGLQNHIDELQDGDLVFTPDNSLKGTLLDFKWADHLLNDMSWLRADTFSWQSGDVYVAAYEHLASEMHIENLYAWEEEEGRNRYTRSATPSVGDPVYTASGSQIYTVESVGADYIVFNGTTCPRNSGGDILGTNAETDTVDGITITYYKADDGHKICLPDQEANVQALYEATGVAWYYILDTKNKQFKLPRTKFGFTGLRDSVGNYVEAGLPNITGELYTGGNYGFSVFTSANGAFKSGSHSDWRASTQMQNVAGATENVYIDASRSSSVYGNSNTVQPKATQMYLYFYVGNFEREALEQTAGITSEQLNSKADISNVQALETRTDILEQGDYVVASQKPTSSNGYTWYRKYKSGWVEQGGITSVSTVYFPIVMADTNYTFVRTNGAGRTATYTNEIFTSAAPRTTTSMGLGMVSAIGPVSWQVSGMAA